MTGGDFKSLEKHHKNREEKTRTELKKKEQCKRTRLTASAWRKANWCINCVLMRVMERRERDNS